MHAEPDPGPSGAGDKFPIDFLAQDWGQAAAWPRAALGLCAIPELGKAAAPVLGSRGTLEVVPGPGTGWETSVADFCSSASG